MALKNEMPITQLWVIKDIKSCFLGTRVIWRSHPVTASLAYIPNFTPKRFTLCFTSEIK